ncbi:MAG TPA: ABC transporter substrate-binding protein [Actinomycetota bacterium]|nr:ABC transporter substrate-binding protein [Actinomycetota bacterium]
MRRFRRVVLGAVLLALVMAMAACGGPGGDENNEPSGDNGGGDKGTVTVGSDSFAEAQIVGEMYAQVLEANGYTVERQLDIESREVRLPAMESGKIDIAPEYLASLLSVIDPKQTATGDPQEVASMLEQPLADKGLETLEPSDVVDTNAFVVTKETADKYDLATDSDLAGPAGDMTLGGPPECPQRPFCIPGLKDTYGVEFGDFKALEYGATITALKGGAIDVGLLYSTDGSIAENDFVLLEDDKHLQAADNITPLVSSDTLSEHPDIADLLNQVSAALDTAEITELNKRANVDVEKPADLAKEFLQNHDLI